MELPRSVRRSLPRFLLGFLLLSMVPLSAARFVVEKNSLTVTSPDKIKGTYDSAIGNFGIPQYGGSMAGAVAYPKENRKGCKEFDEFGLSFKSKPGMLPTILLVDRGDCFFALKVWNAQKAGASAVLVADDIEEALITMDSPEEDGSTAKYIESITIPSALIEKSFGEALKKAISGGDMVNVNLDWREAVPHPDDRVEYELWTNSNDECGVKCDMLMEFVTDFKGVAQMLEKGGYTQFNPHYITWYCPQAFTLSKQCKSQCINHGRYCAPDPEQDFSAGYDGKDVVLENLRQLCVFRVANETKRPWVWWDYVTDFQIRCPMKEKKYNKECADSVIRSLGLDLKKIEKCMGDPNADSENPVLREEQNAQVGKGTRGDVTILPTLVVNNIQYRGKLEKGAVLKAICAGFEETTEPAVCLGGDVETNECLDNNGGCWQDKRANITACKDTFRGRVCECPLVDGVQFKGDGYTTCEASGPGRCKINEGGCWHESWNGPSYSACLDFGDSKCQCPPGFTGDGVKTCEGLRPPTVYDTFISYKRDDTLHPVSHLKSALDRSKIRTFIDFTMDGGVKFRPAINRAIEQSASAVVVISPNFHSSPWCLDEAVKILQCHERWGLKVLPIFWGINARELREQSGRFEENIGQGEKGFKQENPQQVLEWRNALQNTGHV